MQPFDGQLYCGKLRGIVFYVGLGIWTSSLAMCRLCCLEIVCKLECLEDEDVMLAVAMYLA